MHVRKNSQAEILYRYRVSEIKKVYTLVLSSSAYARKTITKKCTFLKQLLPLSTIQYYYTSKKLF